MRVKSQVNAFGRRGFAAVEYVALTAVVMLVGMIVFAFASEWIRAAFRLGDAIAGWTLM